MNINPGLEYLADHTELAGVTAVKRVFGPQTVAPNHDPNCTVNHPRIMFAFWQDDFQGGKIAYWHVMSEGRSKHSTLSMDGLKQWEVL